ncbi:hypothetical protein FOA52_008205 [Chlamydomonas sp. UWO 241]|nr:hypothetical protein FOA52_008205 [Chlamydomonas sp. UWO 241]
MNSHRGQTIVGTTVLGLGLLGVCLSGACIVGMGSGIPLAQAIVGLVCGILLACLSIWSWISRWVTGKANEWILVVSNGRMVKAGVGLTVFRGLYDQVVAFPSVIQKVSWSAEQVSKEVQGLRVSGFCIWSINRIDDGPFKAYRYLDGLSTKGLASANDNLARMCESIIRSAVASMSIDEVIRNREAMREKVKHDMGSIVTGWGVWLETVEVTEVTVCSRSLFEDLQVEFRQQSRQAAEITKLATRERIDEATLQSNMKVRMMMMDVTEV